jgi:DNA polymerase I-like protein with 3'-5' exonuclease and polymerase domains
MSWTHCARNQMPLFLPDSSWTRRHELPDLSGVNVVALDCETKDLWIQAGKGPGWPARAGSIVGLSVAWGGQACYIPINHPDSENFDRVLVGEWLKAIFRSDTTIVFHNAPYDLGWIIAEFMLAPPIHIEDTMVEAFMLDENRSSYSLDAIAKELGFGGKDERILREAAAAYGWFKSADVKGNLWQLPARHVGGYAEADAAETLSVHGIFAPDIQAQNLSKAYQLELDLIPMCLEMRRRGIRVDLARAERARDAFLVKRNQCLSELSGLLGSPVDVESIRSPKKMETLFVSQRLAFPRTETGQGSFKNDWMRKQEHWLPKYAADIGQLTEAADKFMQGYLLDYQHNGRIHATINQFKDEYGKGTRTYRFSYSDPPLQQAVGSKAAHMSEIGAWLAQEFRGCFLPEEGEEWISADFSQQEIRLAIHFAARLKLPKANDAVQQFKDDPNTDFHQYVADLTGLNRREAKDVGFAKIYGAGIEKFCKMTNLIEEKARTIIAKYDNRLPFMKGLSRICMQRIEERGYIILLDGARCRLPKEYSHKAFNSLIQGSAARQTKMAMRTLFQSGIVPLLQVHDEICASGNEEVSKIIVNSMENAVELLLPMRADSGMGPTWGESK